MVVVAQRSHCAQINWLSPSFRFVSRLNILRHSHCCRPSLRNTKKRKKNWSEIVCHVYHTTCLTHCIWWNRTNEPTLRQRSSSPLRQRVDWNETNDVHQWVWALIGMEMSWRDTWDVEEWTKGLPVCWLFLPSFVPIKFHSKLGLSSYPLTRPIFWYSDL